MTSRNSAFGLGALLIALSLGAHAQARSPEEAQVKEGSTGVMSTTRQTHAMHAPDSGMVAGNNTNWYVTSSGEASTMVNGQPNVLPLPMPMPMPIAGGMAAGPRATHAMGASSTSQDVASFPSMGTPD